MDEDIGRSRNDFQLELTRLESQTFLLVLAEEQRLAVLDDYLSIGSDVLAGDILEHRIVEDDAILEDLDE